MAPELITKTDKKRILIVDDEYLMVQLIQAVLTRDDRYGIDIASDGFVAGQKFMTDKPDLVILDLRMPKVGGYQLCRSIRNNPTKGPDVKILVISGMTDERTKAKVMDLGADDFLEKPFDNDVLYDRVQQLLT